MVEYQATCRVLWLTAAAVGLCLAVPDEQDAKALPEGTGKAEVVKFCTECHTSGNFRKTRHDKDEWTDSVADMVERGAKGTPAELAVVVDYLTLNFGTDSKVDMNTAPLEEIKVQLGFTVPESQAVIEHRQRNGRFKEWRDVLKVSGVDKAKVEAKKDKMGFE
ncbi:MAG TPA: helix-hairpin-helix domain-containing protein [Candidatus Acidoferrales bacterium]|nr:helix-hairpin-helix domain-containing protein [Candidatus Acidoferrales bacterium]